MVTRDLFSVIFMVEKLLCNDRFEKIWEHRHVFILTTATTNNIEDNMNKTLLWHFTVHSFNFKFKIWSTSQHIVVLHSGIDVPILRLNNLPVTGYDGRPGSDCDCADSTFSLQCLSIILLGIRLLKSDFGFRH